MRILFVSSEVYPYSKTGGLADVAGALPAALAQLGHEVLVVTPWYASLNGQPQPVFEVDFPTGDGSDRARVGKLEAAGVRLAFVGLEDFDRPSIYGYPDDVRRFCRFSRAVPQVVERLGFSPHLVHVHDWHAGFLPALLAHGDRVPAGSRGKPVVLTIHNAQYQGVWNPEETLHWLALPEAARDAIVHQGDANALASAVALADSITTVSPSYAREILTPEFGYGLEQLLQARRDDLSGILNGVDVSVWNPRTDPLIPSNYSREEMAGKREAKLALCRRAQLDPERPLMGVVSRLAEQKGIDILLAAAPRLEAGGWSLFVLGTGDPELERRARELQDAGVLAAELAFDEGLAHLVYAGSDLLAIPSRFEPCGLSQMVAMRYGTLPLARATGGLRDTIRHGETGFLFEEPRADALLAAAAQARRCFGSPEWARMQSEAMAQDFSWSRSAASYVELYRQLGSEDE